MLNSAAGWCPPCKLFTPLLLSANAAAVALGLPFSVVFVSSDHDAEGFAAYYEGKMAPGGWAALEFEGDGAEERRLQLKETMGCKGIPQLSIILPTKDAEGKVLYKLKTNDGRHIVTKQKEQAIVDWCAEAGLTTPTPAAAPAPVAPAAAAAAVAPVAAAPASSDAFSLDEDF